MKKKILKLYSTLVLILHSTTAILILLKLWDAIEYNWYQVFSPSLLVLFMGFLLFMIATQRRFYNDIN